MPTSLRLFLVALCLPLVIFVAPGTTGPAYAAATLPAAEGPVSKWVGVTFKMDEGKPGAYPGPDCYVAFSWIASHGTADAANGECIGGVDLSPGWSQPGESGGPFKVWYQGPGCDMGPFPGSYEGTLANHEKNQTMSTAGTLPDLVQWHPGQSCEPTHACLRIEESTFGSYAAYRQECVPVAFADTSAGSECTLGTPSAASLGFSYHSNWGIWQADYSLTFQTKQPSSWTVMPLFRRQSEPKPAMNNVEAYTKTFVNTWERGTWPSSLEWLYPSTGALQDILYTDQPANPPVGAGVLVYPSGTGVNAGDYGRTIPTRCIFWIGEKIRDDPNTTNDEPWASLSGPGGDPGDSDPPPESPLDQTIGIVPDTESGFWAALLELIRQLIASVGDLLSAILGLAEAILDGLIGLFVPDPDVIKGELEGLKTAWDGSAVFVVVEAVQDVMGSAVPDPGGGSSGSARVVEGDEPVTAYDVTPGEGGGSCMGPMVTIPVPWGGGFVHLYPFEACSGGMAQLATIVRTGLTVLVYVGAVATGARIIGYTFGLDMRFVADRKLG